ncbi:hypothetical protein V490_02436 [Pseudogymnoascus sp. VKM F-3557]|nr:hypothetical protein V490_02436 [Pseudogymnoascus sp. VKM F-3557]
MARKHPQFPARPGKCITTSNETVFDPSWGPEDYDMLFKKLDDIERLVKVNQPQKKEPLSYVPIPTIHIKGSNWDTVLAPDEDFVIPLLKFPRHEDSPQSDKIFEFLFSEHYTIVDSVVVDNFGGFDIKPDELEWKHPWNEINVSPLFIGLLDLVEDAANTDDPKGWDSLLYDSTKRSMMIVGMLARIFQDKVFSPLLFGCTENQTTMLDSLEKDMAENCSDGFARTKTRSRAIREVLDGDTLTSHFFDEVEALTVNIYGLFKPVTAYLEKYALKHPDLKLTLPTHAEQLKSLFDMVSGVAWLSISLRLHPDPIILRLPAPGDRFDKEFDCVNYEEYCQHKAMILKLKDDKLKEEIERELNEQGPTNAGDSPEIEILKGRESLVKTAIWPSIKIYSPVIGKGSDGQSGIAENTIQKCDVAAHWAVPPNYRATSVSLREWAKLT